MAAESLLSRSAVPPSRQLSQLYRSGFVMPFTPGDEINLRGPYNDDDDRRDSEVEWLPLGESVLFIFWRKGLFRMISAHTEAIIDEHETEWVEAARVGGVQEGVRAFRKKWQVSDPEFLDVLATIELLAEKASRAGVSVVFVL